MGKEDWTEKYAGKILKQFCRWRTPLGVASIYADKLKRDLALFYEDPLKRMFIEATY